jgi:threonine dehydrogenase-like Zn-dependent dehydrogenase
MSRKIRRVLAIDGAGIISVIDELLPSPAPGQVLIEVTASMVSPGSELGGVSRRRDSPTDAPPRPFGYSNAGVVCEIGGGVQDLEIGERVSCIGGGYAQHATHACVPQNMAVSIPDDVSDADASSIHLVATSLNATRRLAPEIAEYIGVVGLGLVGNFATQWARVAGCHVAGLDQLPMRLEVAEACGADLCTDPTTEGGESEVRAFTRDRGLDGAVMAFGGDGTEAFKALVKMMKRAPDTHAMGRVVIVGGASVEHSFGAGLGNLDIRSAARTGPGYHDEAWEHGEDYPPVFVQWSTKRNMEECLNFINRGDILVDPLITHRVSLDDAPEACEALIQTPNDALGVVFLPQES